MKLVFTIFLFLLFAVPSFANEIDTLKTLDEVNQFLKEKVLPKDFDTVILEPSKANTSTHYGKHKFYKLDLNGDSLTDLLADGNYLLAVIDLGGGKYDLESLDRGSFSFVKYTLKNVEWILKSPVLVIDGYKDEDGISMPARRKRRSSTDTEDLASTILIQIISRYERSVLLPVVSAAARYFP